MRKNTLLTNPTKKQLLSFFIIWFVGITLSLMVVTNLFNQIKFERKYLFFYILIIFLTWKMINILRSYLKNKAINAES